jgi:hypothetical protein
VKTEGLGDEDEIKLWQVSFLPMYLSYNLPFELSHDVTSLSDSGLYSDSEDSTSEQEEVVDSDY